MNYLVVIFAAEQFGNLEGVSTLNLSESAARVIAQPLGDPLPGVRHSYRVTKRKAARDAGDTFRKQAAARLQRPECARVNLETAFRALLRQPAFTGRGVRFSQKACPTDVTAGQGLEPRPTAADNERFRSGSRCERGGAEFGDHAARSARRSGAAGEVLHAPHIFD